MAAVAAELLGAIVVSIVDEDPNCMQLTPVVFSDVPLLVVEVAEDELPVFEVESVAEEVLQVPSLPLLDVELFVELSCVVEDEDGLFEAELD